MRCACCAGSPASAVALVALALGIGATTAIFSIVDAVLWRPLPYAQPSSVVLVAEQRPREGRLNGPVSPADFLDWRAMNHNFSAIAAATDFSLNLTDVEPQRLRALAVTTGFFDAFEPAERTQRAAHMFPVVARLRTGVSLAQARADLDEIGRQLAANYPKENASHFPRVVPIREVIGRRHAAAAARAVRRRAPGPADCRRKRLNAAARTRDRAPQGDRHPADARCGAAAPHRAVAD